MRVSEPPRYVAGSSRDEVWAHFPSGVIVRASRGRGRAYPGLAGLAPPTGPLYTALTTVARRGGAVLDVGCGAGAGTRVLVDAGLAAVGIDCDSSALAFARAWVPEAEYVESDLAAPPPLPRASAAIVADVLGVAAEPGTILRTLRELVTDAACVLIGEPAAGGAGRVVSPLRRGFGQRGLASLARRAGFVLEGWACEPGTFLACLVRPDPARLARSISGAEALLGRGQVKGALERLREHRAGRDGELDAEAHALEGRLRLRLGQGDAAARAFLCASELVPEHPGALAGLATLALASGDRAASAALARRACAADPGDLDAAVAAACAAEEVDDSAAERAWETAHAIAPAEVPVAARLAELAARRGDLGRAIAVLERVRSYEPPPPVALHALMARLLAAVGRTGDAQLECKLGLARCPEDEELRQLSRELRRDAVAS